MNDAAVFSHNCATCHTLAAAHAHGTLGPNLDEPKPTAALVARQLTNRGGGTPSSSRRLTKQQIEAVSQYVAKSAVK